MEGKSKVTAGVLGILLGQFGVHNFYLGNKKNAIIQCAVSGGCWLLYILNMILGTLLAFIGVGILFYLLAIVVCAGPMGMAIWGLVEGIMILSGKITTDGNGNPLV